MFSRTTRAIYVFTDQAEVFTVWIRLVITAFSAPSPSQSIDKVRAPDCRWGAKQEAYTHQRTTVTVWRRQCACEVCKIPTALFAMPQLGTEQVRKTLAGTPQARTQTRHSGHEMNAARSGCSMLHRPQEGATVTRLSAARFRNTRWRNNVQDREGPLHAGSHSVTAWPKAGPHGDHVIHRTASCRALLGLPPPWTPSHSSTKMIHLLTHSSGLTLADVKGTAWLCQHSTSPMVGVGVGE